MVKFQVHSARLPPDRSAPAAAEGPVRRVAGAADLLRLLGSRFRLRLPGQPRHQRDFALAGDAGRAGSAEEVDQGGARPGYPDLPEPARSRVRLGGRRRGRPAAAGADAEHPGRRGDQDHRRSARRAGLGLAAEAKAAPAFGKFNPYHDERGRFATAEDAVELGGSPPTGSPPKSAREREVASSAPVAPIPAVLSGADEDARIIPIQAEGDEDRSESDKPERAEESEGASYINRDTGRMTTLRPNSGVCVGAFVDQSARIAGGAAVLRTPRRGRRGRGSSGLGQGLARRRNRAKRKCAGWRLKGSDFARTMPPSDDPNNAALRYIVDIMEGQRPVSFRSGGDLPSGGFVIELPDGTFVTYRPAGQASFRTDPATATVDVNGPGINMLNRGRKLELKFPKR